MRIWMVHPRLDRRGGAENVVESLSRALVARGHQVSVAALRFSARAWPDGAWSGVPVHAIEAAGDRILPRRLRARVRRRRVARLAAGADLLVAHNFPAVLWLPLDCRARRVWYCEEPSARLYGRAVFPTLTAAGAADPSAYPWAGGAFARELARQDARRPRAARLDRRLDARAIAELDAILANSAFTAAAVERVYGVAATPCLLGVAVPSAHRAPSALERAYVAWVTNPRVAKNGLGFLEALRLARAQEPAIAVRAVGLGTALRERASSLALDGALEVLEGLDDARYAQLLAGARLVAVPNIDEPFGLVPIEAMAYGRAVLVSHSGGPSETVLDGVTGVHVDPLDPAAIARALVALWRDPARCEALGRAGHERYLREFTLERFVDRFLSALAIQPSRA
jgi:glycosyltransferase involved in cell wall biosynthesis